MNLDHSIGHDSFKSRKQNVSNNKDHRDYEIFFIKDVKICLMKMGKLIIITVWNFLPGLMADLYMNTLTVCWFNRMTQD